LVADRVGRRDFIFLDEIAIEGQRLDAGRGVERGLVILIP
jgi:hypothetical protein